MYLDSFYDGVDLKENDYKNMVEYRMIEERLCNVIFSLFTWENLPSNLSSRFIEKTLMTEGCIGFYINNEYGIMSLPCTSIEYNFYNEPEKITLSSACNGLSTNNSINDTTDDFVLCRNNTNGTGLSLIVQVYAQKIFDVMQTIDVNIGNQKTPYIIKTNQKNRFSLKNIFDQVRKNMPAVFVNKKIGKVNEIFEIMPTPSPFVADKLLCHQHELMNDFLTKIGINNCQTDKKERLIQDEANSNNELIKLTLQGMINEREKAIEEINKKYGYNITLKCNIEEVINECQNIQQNSDTY